MTSVTRGLNLAVADVRVLHGDDITAENASYPFVPAPMKRSAAAMRSPPRFAFPTSIPSIIGDASG